MFYSLAVELILPTTSFDLKFSIQIFRPEIAQFCSRWLVMCVIRNQN